MPSDKVLKDASEDISTLSPELRERHPNTRKLLAVLADTRFAARKRGRAGRPKVSHFDHALEKSTGYLSRVIRGEISLDADTLFKCLDLFGSAPRKFFAKVFGTDQTDVMSLLTEIQKGQADNTPFLNDIERRLSALDAPSRGAQQQHKSATDRESYAEMQAVLHELDEIRFDDAKEATSRLKKIATKAAKKLPSQAHVLGNSLGILGSAYLMQSKHAAATRSLRLAIRLAESHELDELMASLLQRASAVVADHGNLEEAAEIALQALEHSVLHNDSLEIGRSLIVRAIRLNKTGDSRKAIQCYLSSLRFLPPTRLLARFGAYQGLGLAYSTVGDLQTAAMYADRAIALLPGLPRGRYHAGAFARWLRGEIAMQLKDYNHAEELFAEVAEALADVDRPLDVAIVHLDHARALCRQGKLEEVKKLAGTMTGLMSLLRGNKVAEAAVSEFVRTALEGAITARKMDHLYKKVRSSGSPSLGSHC